MELQTKVEDAKVEVPETDASIFGPWLATPAISAPEVSSKSLSLFKNSMSTFNQIFQLLCLLLFSEDPWNMINFKARS